MVAALPAMGALPARGQVPVPDSGGYIGPLTGVTGLEDRRFDPVAYTRDLYAAAPRRLRFEARTRGQAEEWQQKLRLKLIDLLDYIATRSELDSSRVGCMGVSGGGTATVFAAALEPRIRVAMVSGYLNTFRDSVGSLAHCIDNYVPGILNWAEMHDIAGLIAPRPLFVESGEQDNIFPIKASTESFNRVREIYGVFGAADRVDHEVFQGEHSFWGKRGIPFGARHLSA